MKTSLSIPSFLGVVAGLALVVLYLLFYFTNHFTSLVQLYIKCAAMIFVIMRGMKIYRDNYSMSYRQGVKIGLVISLIVALILAVYTYVFLQYIAPNMLGIMLGIHLDMIVKGMDNNQLIGKITIYIYENQLVVPAYAIMRFLMEFFGGLLLTLIIAIFMKQPSRIMNHSKKFVQPLICINTSNKEKFHAQERRMSSKNDTSTSSVSAVCLLSLSKPTSSS